MSWSNSKIFRQYLADMAGNTAALDLDADTIKVSLHNNSITPNQDVSAANSAFNAGVWATTNEVTDATNWVSGGRALSGKSVDVGTAATVFFDATDLAGGGTVTLSAFFGCLVYDDTLAAPVADQGICFVYFGGSQSVTGGNVTLQWHANGLWRITL